jgi:putative ABC transport system ATP-binding protein
VAGGRDPATGGHAVTVNLFEADGLSRHYPGVRAVDGVTLAVEAGTVLVVTGPSGSGKTTLLALLGALERPTAGRVAFAGTDLGTASGAELARVRRRLGFVFQDFALVPGLTALENVTYPLIPRGVSRAERLRRASDLLNRFGLSHKLAARAGTLSGGEQQRVAIVRAFAGQPDAILADEPTSNLDADTAGLFLTALADFRAAGGTAVLASHDPRVLAAATVRAEMVAGRLVGI